jgi:hypothetical protein
MAKDKQLKDKAIDIKGKKYVLVSDRVTYFNETYPNGDITTDLTINGDMMIIKATVTPDIAVNRKFTGYSQGAYNDGNYINKTSAIENAETSAVGRALAFMGIGVIESIASVDEVNKAEGSKKKVDAKIVNPPKSDKITPGQLKAIFAIASAKKWLKGSIVTVPGYRSFKISDLTVKEASRFIDTYGKKEEDEQPNN